MRLPCCFLSLSGCFSTQGTLRRSPVQIGEFSFILATVARDLGLLPDPAHNALVAASILSISLNPLFYRLIDGFEMKLKMRPSLWRVLNARASGMQSNDGRPV